MINPQSNWYSFRGRDHKAQWRDTHERKAHSTEETTVFAYAPLSAILTTRRLASSESSSHADNTFTRSAGIFWYTPGTHFGCRNLLSPCVLGVAFCESVDVGGVANVLFCRGFAVWCGVDVAFAVFTSTGSIPAASTIIGQAQLPVSKGSCAFLFCTDSLSWHEYGIVSLSGT